MAGNATVEIKNRLFPVFLKLEKLNTLVVGGGKVGLEKLNALLANSPDAPITLVAKQISDEVKLLASTHPNVLLKEKAFEENDLTAQDIVILAVDDHKASAAIKKMAQERNILCNVADTPDLCDFYLSSIVQKGNLKVAISTNGKSPTMAKRVKETLNHALPDEIDQSLENLEKVRATLSGDFAYKVKKLNEVTAFMSVDKTVAKKRKAKQLILYVLSALSLMIVGHLLFSFLPYREISDWAMVTAQTFDEEFLYFVLGGFIAQMIDGALGMAYGVSATTFLLSFGISPAVASASVHASEIFTSGVSGLMHLKFGNVNSRLFKNLLIPGVVGAIIGALLLASLSEYDHIIRPIVASYTLFLGVKIILKALKKHIKKKKTKGLTPLGLVGGFFDAIGGGGWGPIVSSTLIANGRHPKYTIGSVNLAEFFVAMASSLTFITIIGFTHWQVILGLILGGMIGAPISVSLAKRLPVKTMMIFVGVVVVIVSLRIIYMMIM